MQEICQSGSEGGAKANFVPTPIVTPKEPSRRVRCDSRRCGHRFDDWSDEKPPKLCLATGLWRIERWYSQVQQTVHYIEQQLEHHRTRTFQEEYLAFLKKHGAHFDEKYLWD
jgi:REP-associated tyrosine transposase